MIEHQENQEAQPPTPRLTLEELRSFVGRDEYGRPMLRLAIGPDQLLRAVRELIEVREAGERRRKEMWDALRRGPAGEEERIG